MWCSSIKISSVYVQQMVADCCFNKYSSEFYYLDTVKIEEREKKTVEDDNPGNKNKNWLFTFSFVTFDEKV